MDVSDRTLLHRYLTCRDEAAFGILVSRYIDFVHALARRVTGNDEQARDVAQSAFIRLAQRAALIPPDLTLATWFHRITRGLALDLMRAETRRKKREISSTLLTNPMDASAPEPDWSALAPVVDELVDRLPAADRDVLLLRYYRNEPHAVVAAQLGLTEDVARKRAFRAVEKLRVLLGKRGIATSPAALATLLPAHAAPTAPVLLSASVLHAAKGISPAVPHFLTCTLLTVSTSQKMAFAAAVLLLMAATGYTLSPDPSAASVGIGQSATDPTGIRGVNKLDPNRHRTPRAVPATAEDRMERLKTIMAINSSVDRHVELLAYLDGLPPALFEETEKFLIAHGKDQKAVILTASAWAKANLPAALTFAAAQPYGSLGRGTDGQILTDWKLSDPKAALEWAATKSANPRSSATDTLRQTAYTNPEDLGKLIRDMPAGEIKLGAFGELIPLLERDPVRLQKVISGATESQRAVIYSVLASSNEDPEKGIAILMDHPEAVPFANSSEIYSKWADRDPTAASAAVAELPPGQMQREGVFGLIQQSAKSAPAKALELMEEHPEAVPEEFMPAIIRDLGDADPGLALSQVDRISDQDERNAAVVARLKTWLKKDPHAVGEWLEGHPQPQSILKKLPTGH